MSKARTLANLISDNAVLADGQIAVAEVTGAAPLASPTFSGNVTTTGSFVVGNASLNENDLESIDGITAGTVAASKAVVVNSNKDASGFRNISLTGTVDGRDIATNIPASLGTAGQVLTVNSGASAGEWADAGGGADLYAANESSPTAQPSATGTNAIAIGDGAISSNTKSFALGKSRASANLSFAAAIQNNTTSKGATGNQCIAMGYGAYAPGSNSVAIALNSNSGNGSNNLAMMRGSITGTKSNSLSIGYYSRADESNATALGYHSVAISKGKFAYQGNTYRPAGHGQMGLVNISGRTTDATPKVLSNNDGLNLDYAQLLIPNNTSYTFTGVISAREKASEGTDVGGWEVKGVIRREGSASTTTLVNSIINDINVPTGWAVAVSADTTNGALSVTVTGVASTNITWIANNLYVGGYIRIMGSINLKHTGSGSAIALSSDGTSLLLDGTAIGGGGADLYAENYDGTSTKPSATGANAIALGYSSVASGSRSLALIQGSTASGTRSIAAGLGAVASGVNSIAIGSNTATASAQSAIALGADSVASGSYSVAFTESRAGGVHSFAAAIDNNTTSYGASGVNSIAMGYLADADYRSVAIGYNVGGSGSYGISLGSDSGVGIYASSAAIGRNVQSTASNQVSIGGSTQDVRISEVYTLPKVDGTASGQVLTTNGSGVVSWATPSGGGATSINGLSDGFADSKSNLGLGDNSAFGNITTAYRNIALGWNTAGSITTGDDNTLLGRNVSSFLTTGTGNTAVGASALPGSNLDKMTGNYNTAVGQSAANSIRFGDSGTFIGHNSNGASNADFQTAIGYNAVTGGVGATALTNSRASGASSFAAAITNNTSSYGASSTRGISIGAFSHASGSQDVISIGYSSIGSADKTTAVGYRTQATNANAVALGSHARATGHYSLAISSATGDSTGALSSGISSIAIGSTATASHQHSAVLGNDVQSTATNQVNVGGSTQDVRISETYTLPKVDGTAGQVLSTDGNGNVSWVTP